MANWPPGPNFGRVMKPAYLTPAAVDAFIEAALREDLGTGPGAGDHSALAAVPAAARRRARLLVKDHGVLAGIELAGIILRKVDPSIELEFLLADGQAASPGQVAFTAHGNARAILQGERLLLNCMQRMSGIATLARQAVELLAGTNTQILDTRKTTPNFRLMEKWAVHIGGGRNHRFGLFDMMMLKDNHNDYAGGIGPAMTAALAYREQLAQQTGQPRLRLEVEARNLAEVAEILAVGGADVIMLDNMSLDHMAQAVQLIGGGSLTEASGGLTLEQLPAVAATGVNFISMGALTHSARNLDLSLKAY
jgi:nicotinate-nucleotide pyrophosphorylase (carboxylating)